jgi:hypothetical protein
MAIRSTWSHRIASHAWSAFFRASQVAEPSFFFITEIYLKKEAKYIKAKKTHVSVRMGAKA